MRPVRIDQVVHILAYNDAIGNHVMQMREVLRGAGFASDIYYGEVHPELKAEARPLEEMPAERPGSWLLFHHSIGTKVVAPVLARREPLVIDYHNITPPELIDGWAPGVVAELELGEEQLRKLAPKAFYGMAHSEFSEGELKEAGCARSRVVPPLFEMPAFSDPDRSVVAQLSAEKQKGGSDWLFVGRISPHKAQHDLVKALACSRQLYDSHARLHLVGTSLGEDYPRAVQRFAARLGVAEALEMPGAVSSEVLSAYFDMADVFVCVSDHEGFCVPLVEAMARGVPVVAYDSAAVGETVGDAGLVLEEKSALTVATAVDRVRRDESLSQRLSGSGKRRASELSMPASGEQVVAAIEEAVKIAEELGIS
jgi:glycosyltransferase involved in cell wall biosynthesis